MSTATFAGLLLIVMPVAFNVAFGMLAARFDYPDSLRRPADEVLSRFEAGGTGLVLLWWSFAMTAVLFAPLLVLLSQAIVDADQTLLALATTVGVLAANVQFLGLIRWPFLVPYLARAASAPDATPARLEAVDVVFQCFNRYLGVAVGEHLGYAWVEDGDGKCIPGSSSARLRARVGSAASRAPTSCTPRLTRQRW